MYIKFVSILSALVLGSAAFLGLAATPAFAETGAQATPVVSTAPQSSQPQAQTAQTRLVRVFYHLRRGLIQAAANVTGKTPKEIVQDLKNGQSLSGILTSAGKSTQEFLEKFDDFLKSLFARIEGKTKLPDSKLQQVQTRIESAVSNLVDKNGFPLNSAFPEPMLLRQVLIRSAIQVGGLEPSAVKTGLQNCQSLNDLLVASGHTGQEAVTAAMNMLTPQLDKLLAVGKITKEQHDKLDTTLSTVLGKLVDAPGLRPNQECTPKTGNS